MSDTNETSQAQDNNGQEPTTDTTHQQENQAQENAQASQPNSVDELPDWARQELRKARDEAAKYRTRAKNTEEQVTSKAQAERDELIQTIGKQLGLIEDDNPDPEKLIKAAQEREAEAAKERDTMREQLNTYRRNDAVREAVATVDGKVDTELLGALLQSDNEWQQLNVDADDFNSQVEKIVTRKLENHPSLIQAIHKASGVDTSNTHRGVDKPMTRDDLKNMSAHEINQAVKAGKLSHLMTD